MRFNSTMKKNVKLIDWPPYSPDLNPIENAWTLMKRKISGRKFTSMNSLKNELYKIWADIEIKQLRKYEWAYMTESKIVLIRKEN